MVERSVETVLSDGDLLNEARRLVRKGQEAGAFYPHASQPLYWSRAAVIAQVDLAVTNRKIAASLDELVRAIERLERKR